MATYVYKCTARDCSCFNVEFEAKQSMLSPPLKTCSACWKDTLEKVLQPNGVRFIGAGFYKNDYGRGQ